MATQTNVLFASSRNSVAYGLAVAALVFAVVFGGGATLMARTYTGAVASAPAAHVSTVG
jgi:hypothetical protein